MINKNRFLIIGGTGTLGKSLAKRLLEKDANCYVLIYSRDEVKQLEMMREFGEINYPNLKYMIGDVRDLQRLTEACKQRTIVINAAALKHVVIAEQNPIECHKTNVEGTKNVIKACLENDVKKCILISTDKAVDPIGVYGKSKKDAEDLFLRVQQKEMTAFSIIRFGNIIGSRGSVSEVFKEMVKAGKLSVTDKEATRFGITVQCALDFLIERISTMKGGEIFTPVMRAFKVVDLARVIGGGCEIEVLGLRPGDKLHEAVINASGEKVYSNEVEQMSEEEIRLTLGS